MAAELIHGGAPPEATYVFKHALVQDTADTTAAELLNASMLILHGRSRKSVDEIEAAPAAIARHERGSPIRRRGIG